MIQGSPGHLGIETCAADLFYEVLGNKVLFSA